jgi:HK97 family phage major capsid protein
MAQTITELKQLRAKAIKEMREILDIASAEGRSLSAEETEKYDRIESDVDGYTATVDRQEKQHRAESSIKDIVSESRVSSRAMTKQDRAGSDEYRNAFNKYMRYGSNALVGEEARTLTEGTDSEGGYLTETILERRLVEGLADNNIMRSLCTVVNTTSDRNISVLDTVGDAAWLAESGTYAPVDTSFSQVSLGAYKASTLMLISEELLQDSVFDLTTFVSQIFSRRLGELEEASMIAGSGSGQPTGAVNGASTGHTLATINTWTADDLLDFQYSLKRQYRRNGSFIFNDASIKDIRKLQDANDHWIWQPSMRDGEPDRLLGNPVYSSYDMAVPSSDPSSKCGLFGDFKMAYYIADRGGTSFQRLNELYAVSAGAVGFRAYRRVDGKVVLPEAMKVMLNAAS